MSITVDQAAGYIGQTLYGSDGKIGKIGQVYLDDETRQPEWVTVSTGLFGTKESFVPLAGATPGEDGLNVPFTKSMIKDAPRVDVDADSHLSPDEEDRLYRHYEVDGHTTGDATTGTTEVTGTDVTGTSDVTGTTDLTEGTDDRDERRTDVTASTDRVDSGDDAMTRSEERLNVGTEQRVTGRARLRKYIETEHQTVQVPVRREKVRLETEPITEGNRDEAFSGQEIGEAEHEVTLSEERPVVTTETVPVERVRVGKEVVQETETVQGEVRKERIDLDTDEDVRRG